MARPTTDRRRPVPPQARVIAGWAAAIGIIVLAAFFVGRIGNADGVPPVSSGSVGPSGTPLPIAFGTGLDAVSGEVAEDLTVDRFGTGDTFAYSVRPESPPDAPILYVEVVRVGGDGEAVQTPAPQDITPGAAVIAYTVPTDNLLAEFGPGRYLMRIYLDRAAPPVAEGEFELVEPAPSG